MNNSVGAKAKAFFDEYKIREVTLAELKRIIANQGYTIVEFNRIFNDEYVTELIEVLDLEEIAKKSNGFTYADKHRRLVFLHEDLSENEKLLVLAHEEGHIYCGHLSSASIIGKDVVEEHEANEFTHYILNRSIYSRFSSFIKEHSKAISVAVAVLVAFAIGLIAFDAIREERSYYGEYYITSTGNKYHEEACIFVKDKTSVRRMIVDEYESGDYEPCGICLPHTNTNTESEK